jgi:N-sulfoglucosamine sulfohydrolase
VRSRSRVSLSLVLAVSFGALNVTGTYAQSSAESAHSHGRPNILLALSDDQSWPHASAYGSKTVRTPAFDRVARGGALFTHAFCAASQCSISRATLLAGRYPWQLEEAGVQASLFPNEIAVYTDLLAAQGYHVGYTGKPWGPGDWRAGGRNSNPSGKAYDSRRLEPPTSQISSIDYAGNFEEFLNDRDDGSPFCFWFGCYEPHRNYERGSGRRSGKQLTEAIVPPFFPDNATVRSDLLDYYLEIEWFDQQLGKMIALLERCEELENTLIIVTSDNGMPFPRTKATLYEDGTRMPFAVQWPARIESGRVIDELISFVDVAPTILEAARLEPSSEMTGRSLLPMLENRGGRVKPHRSFVLMGKERHNHARAENVGYPIRAIRTNQYLYLRNLKPDRWPMGDPPGYFCHTKMLNPTKSHILEKRDSTTEYFYQLTYAIRAEEELYDIRSDPHCLENLAESAAFASTKEQLWNRLKQELEEQGDPRLLGYGDIIDSYPFYGRVQPTIPGFKEVGKYNPAFWPASRGPRPTLPD